MPRPDIHDNRNNHLAQTIQHKLFMYWVHYENLSGEDQIKFIQQIIEEHFNLMGLCLLDENGD